MAIPYPGNDDWPIHFQAGTITGTFIGLGGVPRTGYLTLTPSPEALVLVDDQITVVPEQLLSPMLDEHGHLAFDVPATDDPNVSPVRWTYHVVEVWDGGRQYDLKVSVGETVDISAGAPIPSSFGAPRYVGPKGDTGSTGPTGPQGIPGTADLGPVTLSNTGISSGKVPTATDATHGDWEYPLGIPIAGTPGPAKWLSSDDDGLHARWAQQDVYASTTYTASATYISPVGVRALWLMINAAGAGGGGGARGSSTPGGGSGGGGGGVTIALIRAGNFGSYGTDNGDGTFSFPVNIGAGGPGGVATTSDNSAGHSGTDGGFSSFGTGIYQISATGGVAGGAGGTVTGVAGGNGGSGTTEGGDGGKSDTGLGATAARMRGGSSGGGAGGSIDGLGTSHGGGGANLAAVSMGRSGAGAGGAASASGVDGADTLLFHPAQGGGGGGSSTTTTGGNGGKGGAGGGGGGGGGAVSNGHTSGAGGAGGDGRVLVIELY